MVSKIDHIPWTRAPAELKLRSVTPPPKSKTASHTAARPKAPAKKAGAALRAKPNTRRALSHVGGEPKIVAPSPEVEAHLRKALRVASDERQTMAHMHGFHSYPARLHPQTARQAVDAWSQSGQRVLDPFCGSGTVLVEARLAGRAALGNDANPLAIELSWLKARGSSVREREAVLHSAQKVADLAYERRRTRAGSSRRYPEADVEMFAPHVLLELDSIRVAIETVEQPYARRALQLVLSATLTKASQRISDSTRHQHDKRVAAGFVSRFFVDKTRELTRRLSEFAAKVPQETAMPEVFVGDARNLCDIEPSSIDLVVSSPPYPGVYDYFAHHETRLRWLDLPVQGLQSEEIGSRRELSRMDADEALATWKRDFGAVHRELRRVLAQDGRILWVIADSVVGRRALWANELTAEVASTHGFEVEALASQPRPYFHQHTAAAFHDRPRMEHLVVLRRRPESRR